MKLKFREPVNGLTHFYSAIAAVFGTIYLVAAGWGNTGKVVSFLIYGISLVLLFSASATYHLADAGPKAIQTLRKFDHSAIFILIAGTYTPICYNLFTGFWHWGLLAIIWGLAIAGIILKVLYMKTPRWLTAGIYVVMGWLCVLALPEMIAHIPTGGLIWLLAGGIFYTVGAVIYSTRAFNFYPGKFGFHEIWHIFVMLGALAHYVMIAVYII